MVNANDQKGLGKSSPFGNWFDTLTGILSSDGEAGVPDSVPVILEEYAEAVPQLQLSLTYACNMNCSYCSFRDRMTADGRPLSMDVSVADKAVDFFVANVLPTTRHARIDFGLTGETFLRHKVHETLRKMIAKKLSPLGIRSVTVGPNTTNGSLSEAVGIDESMGPPQDISCDGPPDVHDAVRPFVDGTGTYATLIPVIRQVLARHPDIGVTAVVTNRCTDVTRIFRHLFDDLGFRSLYIKPVNLRPDDPDGLSPTTVGAFMKGYSDFVDFLFAAKPEDKLRYIVSLNSEDFFMRYFLRVMNRTRSIYRCGAGKSGAFVDTDGQLYPCAHFIGKTDHAIGDVENGFDEEKRNAYRRLSVDTREPCKSCWGKYICGGGCYYQAVLANGAIDLPDEAKCTLVLHLISEAIRLYEHLANDHPAILRALPAGTYLPDDWGGLEASARYVPVSALRPAPANSVNLLTADHLEQSLPRANEDLSLSISAQGKELTLCFSGHDAVLLSNVRLWYCDLDDAPVLMSDLQTFSPDVFGEQLLWDGDRRVARVRSVLEGPVRSVPFPEPVPEWLDAADGVAVTGSRTLSIDLDRFLPGATTVGLNLTVTLSDGRTARLVRAEPFLSYRNVGGSGALSVETPAWVSPSERPAINATPFEGMIALSEWQGLQPNVC